MTACSRPVPNCPECGDDLIHLANRGQHESSSAFGQYIHDRGEREKQWREMFWMDVDGALYKSKTKILRIIEHKPLGGQLSKGQKEVLPLLAKGIQLLVGTGLVGRGSGVFVVYSDHPHDAAVIDQVRGWPLAKVWQRVELNGPRLEAFLCGEYLSPADDMNDVYSGEEFE